MSDSEVLYEKILFENEAKGFQLRLVVSEFKDIQYLHIRKYFLSFEDGYVPSKEGISMAASISNIYALLDGLIEICSHEEGIDAIATHFAQKIKDLTLLAN
jgi:hypothetical protein